MVPLSWASVAIGLSLVCGSISTSAMPQAPRASVDQSCFMRGATTQLWPAGASNPTITFTVSSINFGTESRNGAGVVQAGRPFPPALSEVGSKARVETFLRISFPGLYKFYVSSSDPSTFSLAPVDGRPLNPESAVNFPEGDLDVLVTEYRMLMPGLYNMVIDFTKEKAGTIPQLKLEWEYSGSQAATPSAAGRRISRGAIWRQQMYVHNCPDSLLAEPTMRPRAKPVAVPEAMVPNPMGSVPSFSFAKFAQVSPYGIAATAALPAPVQQAVAAGIDTATFAQIAPIGTAATAGLPAPVQQAVAAGIDPALIAAMPVYPPPLPILEEPAVTGVEIPEVGTPYSGAMPDPVFAQQGAYGTVPTPYGTPTGSYGGSVITALPRPLFGRRLFGMDPAPMQMEGPNPLPMRPSEIFGVSLQDHPVMAANPNYLAGAALPSSLAGSLPPLRAGIAVPGLANLATPAETSPDHITMAEAMAHSSLTASAPSAMADVPMSAAAPGRVEIPASVPMPGHGMVSMRNPIAPTVPISISTTKPVASAYQQANTMVGALPRNMYMPGQANPAATMEGAQSLPHNMYMAGRGNPAASNNMYMPGHGNPGVSMEASRMLPLTQFSGSVAAETVALPHLPRFARAPSAMPQRMWPRRHSDKASQRPVDSAEVGLGDFMNPSIPYPAGGQGTPLPIVEEGPAPGVVGEPVGITNVPLPQPVPEEPEPLPVTGGVIGEPMTQGSDAPVPGPVADPAQIVTLPAIEPVPTEVVGDIIGEPIAIASPPDTMAVPGGDSATAVALEPVSGVQATIIDPMMPAADALTPSVVPELTGIPPDALIPAIPADALTPAIPADALTPAVSPEVVVPAELTGIPPDALTPAIPADALTPAIPADALTPAVSPEVVVPAEPVPVQADPAVAPAEEPVVALGPVILRFPKPVPQPIPVPATELVPSTAVEVPSSMPVPADATPAPAGEPVPIYGDPAVLPMGEPIVVPAELVPTTAVDVPMSMPVPADATPAPAGEPVPVMGDPAMLPAGDPVVVPTEPLPTTAVDVPMSMPVPADATPAPVGEPVPVYGDPVVLPMGEPVVIPAEPLPTTAVDVPMSMPVPADATPAPAGEPVPVYGDPVVLPMGEPVIVPAEPAPTTAVDIPMSMPVPIPAEATPVPAGEPVPVIGDPAMLPAGDPVVVPTEPLPTTAVDVPMSMPVPADATPAGEPIPVIGEPAVLPAGEPVIVPAEPVPTTAVDIPMSMPVPADATPAPAGEPVPVYSDPVVLPMGEPVVVPAEPLPTTAVDVPMSMPVPADATPAGEPIPVISDPVVLPMGEPFVVPAEPALPPASDPLSLLNSTNPAALVNPVASAPAEQLTAVVLEPVSATAMIAPIEVTGPYPEQATPVPLMPTLDANLLMAPMAPTGVVGEPVAMVAGEGGVINQAMIVTQAPAADAGEPKLEPVRAMSESKAEEYEHKEKREENELNPAFDIGRAGGAGSYGSYGEKGAYFAVHSSPHYFPLQPEEIQPIAGGNRRRLLSNPRLSLRANPLEAALDATIDDARDFRPVAMNTFVTEETFKGLGGKPSHKRVTLISVVEQEEETAPAANTALDFSVDDDLFTGTNMNAEGEDDGAQEDDGDIAVEIPSSDEAPLKTMSIRPVLETPQPIPSGSWFTKISKALQADSAHPSNAPNPLDAARAAAPSGNTTATPRRPAQSIAGALFTHALAWLSKQVGARDPESTVAAEAPSAQPEAARASADEKAWKDYVNHQVWAGLFNEPSVLHHMQAPEEDTHDAELAQAHRLGAKWDDGGEDDEVLVDNILLTPLPTRPAPKAYLKRMFHGIPQEDLPGLAVPEHVKQPHAPAAPSKRSQDLTLHFLGMPHQDYAAAPKVSGSKPVAEQAPNKAGADEAASALKGIDFNVPEWLGDRLRSLLPAKPAPT